MPCWPGPRPISAPSSTPSGRSWRRCRAEGDEAVARFTRDFDKATVSADSLRVSQDALDAAPGLLEPEVMAAIDFAADSIRRFHEAQLPEEMWWKEVRPGVFAGDRIRPIPSVACYVPRGKGAFPRWR